MSIRVVIIDDSPFVREVLRDVLGRYRDIEIVGEAADGRRAEKLVNELRPDVVTMDVVMPMKGGLDAIRDIMRQSPTSVVVVADVHDSEEQLALDALNAGAVDVFPKPPMGFDLRAAERLADLLRAAARLSHPPPPPPVVPDAAELARRLARLDVVGIVASTGGPQTLRRILERVRTPGRMSVAICQHTARGFTGALASWLSNVLALDIELARAGQRVTPGQLVIAPDDFHLEIDRDRRVVLHQRPPVAGHRPSGNVLLKSLAVSFGSKAGGIVCTGMGRDGADGLREIEAAGGLAIVEEPEGAVLAGMPRAAARRAPRARRLSAASIGNLLNDAATDKGCGR